jgi:hypothetical protein
MSSPPSGSKNLFLEPLRQEAVGSLEDGSLIENENRYTSIPTLTDCPEPIIGSGVSIYG